MATRTPRHGFALVALLGLSVLLVPQVAAAKPGSCRAGSSNTLTGSGDVRVFRRSRSVMACVLATGRARRLGTAPAAQREDHYHVDAVQAGGRFVAYVLAASGLSSQGPFYPDRLMLLDTRGWRHVAIGALGCEAPAEAQGYAGLKIGSFGVTRSGSLGWGCYGGALSVGRVEVRSYDSTGSALVDSSDAFGPDSIDYASVVVSDGNRGSPGRLYWSRGNSGRTAPIH